MANIISINGPSTTLSLPSPWDDLEVVDFSNSSSLFKKVEYIEGKKDLLALSVARWRLDKQNNGQFYTLTDDALLAAITDEDQAEANKIRSYYQKKFIFWELKEVQLTSFRQELKTFIHTDGLLFKESMIPIVWRLPEFYAYDIEFEDFRRDYEHTVSPHLDDTRTLTLVKTFDVHNKAGKRREYWFSDEYKNLVYIPVANTNPLFSLMEYVTKTPIKVNATYNKKIRDDKEYYKPYKLKFI